MIEHICNRIQSKGCRHPGTIGYSIINEIEIGLCVDCRKLINIKSGRVIGTKKNKEVVYKWFSDHSGEINNFNLWETI